MFDIFYAFYRTRGEKVPKEPCAANGSVSRKRSSKFWPIGRRELLLGEGRFPHSAVCSHARPRYTSRVRDENIAVAQREVTLATRGNESRRGGSAIQLVETWTMFREKMIRTKRSFFFFFLFNFSYSYRDECRNNKKNFARNFSESK